MDQPHGYSSAFLVTLKRELPAAQTIQDWAPGTGLATHLPYFSIDSPAAPALTRGPSFAFLPKNRRTQAAIPLSIADVLVCVYRIDAYSDCWKPIPKGQ